MHGQAYETAASQVHTGQVIAVRWDGYRRRIEVKAPVWQRFTNPEGQTRTVIRWLGWGSYSDVRQHGELKVWGGESPAGKVLVVDDYGDQQQAWGTLEDSSAKAQLALGAPDPWVTDPWHAEPIEGDGYTDEIL